jgi:DNA-directed RNA polymerase subunit RPC12/RpoP
MADMKFTCSHCGQEIECDELWSGHEIQCPTCQKQLTVPPKPDAPPHASLASAQRSAPKLSIGQSRAELSAAPKSVAPQAAALEARLSQAKANQGSGVMKWVTVGIVVIVLTVGGIVGYPYIKTALAKRSEAAKPDSSATNQQTAAAAAPDAAAAAPATPAPAKELPVLPPLWSLDAEKASIPKSKVNGSISGTNFLASIARLDKVGPTYLLRLLQGAATSPDMGFMIYMYPNTGESITNHTWTISPDMRGHGVPQIVKLWKPDPRYQARQKSFSTGYAMKLELGEATNGVIAGQIYLAVPPESEQSVIAGMFKAETTIGEATAGATPAAAPTPAQASPAAAERSAFDKRYGTRK